VLFDSGCILRYDKHDPVPEMQHIDYGLSVLRADTLRAVPEDRPADLADLFRHLVAEGQMAGMEVTTRFYEIGSPGGLQEAARYLSMQEKMQMSFYAEQHLNEAAEILARLDTLAMERMARLLAELREREGRLFILGVGGGAGHASHAVNDFRKIAGIECYAPTDNVSELTARVNDEGWDTTFAQWLAGSRLRSSDMLLVFSVGGGSLEHNVSPNLVRALQYAQQVGAGIIGIVGRDGGYTARVADACVVVPTVNAATITPHTEAFQAVIWHLLVSHPLLQIASTKWESVGAPEAASPLIQAVVGQSGVTLRKAS
jgi:D-sedoheptulose 7-phosphate isomerase